MAALAGYGGSVLMSTLPNIALSNEVLTDAGDHKIFNEPTASKRYWDRSATFVVQTTTNGTTWTTATAGTYTIRYVSGQIILATALTGTAPGCRIASGAYLPYSTLIQISSWEVVPAGDMLDASAMGSNWKAYVPGQLGATAKLGRFYLDNSLAAVAMSGASNIFVISLLTGGTPGGRWEGFALLKQDDIKSAVSALVTEDIDIQTDGQLYYVAA